MKDKYKHIEDLFEGKFEDFELDPPNDIWAEIGRQVDYGSKGAQRKNLGDIFSQIYRNALKVDLSDIIKKVADIALPEILNVKVAERIETVKKLSPDLILYLKKHNKILSNINPYVFEHLIAEFFAFYGYCDVRLVGKNPVTSADIFAINYDKVLNEKFKYFIEVKRTNNKLGIDVINQVMGAYLMEKPNIGWDSAIIVSLAGFKDFKKISVDNISYHGVKLKDHQDVERWLDDYIPHKNGLWLPKPVKDLSDLIR